MKVPSGHQQSNWMMTALGTGILLSAAPALAEAPVSPAAPDTASTLSAPAPVANEPIFATPTPAAESAISRSNSSVSTYVPANPSVVLRLQERRVYLYSSDMLVSSYPVAIGTEETPTPQGEFSVGNMVVNPVWQSPWTGEVHEPGPDSALGVRWIEFAESEEGVFGFHGTPTLDSIGQAASNGCVRMRNEDVTALFAQVSPGTPVIVEP